MARPGRPVSENYQPICCSVSQSGSYSSETGIMGLEEDNDQVPIFSISKSSMDVVMSAGPSHKRDPTWTRMHLRRSSSANTHSEHNAVMLQQLHPHMWQHINSTNSHQLALSTQNVSVHSPSLLSERRIGSMQRWSGCSGSTHSRSSTPETIVWRGGTSRPSSLTQEVYYSATPDSLSKLSSAPTTPSPFTSPLDTPTLSPIGLLNSASTLTLNANQQEDPLVSSPAPSSPSSPSSPSQAHNSSPLSSNSPNPLLSDTKDESLLEDNLLSFQLPSPKPSSVSLAEGSADGECLGDDKVKELQGPESSQLSEDGGEAEKMFSYLSPSGEEPESGSGQVSVCQLELPRQLWDICPPRGGWRSPLVSSLSDSGLGDCCNLISRMGVTKDARVEAFREEGTMTSQPQLVDAEVQTITPMGSWWNLKRNTFTSNMGSHSLLGSPPGSRLNLKSSVGSNSNLVSPSSSMFPISSEDDEEERQGDDTRWDITSASSHDMERRRSCLKNQGEERDELGRRSSMKQVQWDEDGMTWDVHGASVDPEVLSTAIQKHLELQNSPVPPRRSSKKRKAPKPPLISSVVKAMAPDLNPNVIMSTTCTAQGESEEMPEEEEEKKTGGAKKEEAAEVPCRISRAEGEYMRDEEEEVYGEVGLAQPKSPSVGSTLSHKRSVIRSLRRPGWCGGGSRKPDN